MGLPLLNRPDLAIRMIKSIDHPVGRLYVIDNGGVVEPFKARTAEHIHIVDPGYNMGVAASWNLTIRANVDAPWWMFVNNDLVLEPGALERLATHMDATLERPTVAGIQMGNEAWGNHYGAHAVNALAVEVVGWFDEQLHPIYWEDTDHRTRCQQIGVAFDLIPSTTRHDGNESWKGNEKLAAANKRSWAPNAAYFDRKLVQMEQGMDVRVWTPPPLSRLRAQAWPIPPRNNVR